MLLNALSRVLPPPSYLTLPCIGVDISETSLKYIAFKSDTKPGSPKKIDQWGSLDIPNGVMSSGSITDPVKMAAVLKEFKVMTKAEHIRVSLPEERAYLFETEIKANTPQKEIRSLLEFRLEENVPIPSRDVSFDYSIIPTSDDSKTVHIAVAAYSKETVQMYYDACVTAGLRPLSFEIEAQAMARAVIPNDIDGAVMLVDFGKTRTGIGIVYRGALLYTSTIDIGGNQLSEAMRRVLGDVSERDLTQIKNTQGLSRGVDSSEVRDALITTISIIKDELSTRMQYWHMRSGDLQKRRIKAVILCGGSANLKGLPNYLTETLGVPCSRCNVWENVFSLADHVPPIDKPHSLGYATAIGLALKNIV